MAKTEMTEEDIRNALADAAELKTAPAADRTRLDAPFTTRSERGTLKKLRAQRDSDIESIKSQRDEAFMHAGSSRLNSVLAALPEATALNKKWHSDLAFDFYLAQVLVCVCWAASKINETSRLTTAIEEINRLVARHEESSLLSLTRAQALRFGLTDDVRLGMVSRAERKLSEIETIFARYAKDEMIAQELALAKASFSDPALHADFDEIAPSMSSGSEALNIRAN